MKRCTKCGESKPIDCFQKNKRTRDGLQFWCKACKAARHKETYCPTKDRERRLMNKEKISKGKHQYYEKNKERLLAYCKKWHSNNKDRVRENRRKYMERHLGQAERDAARLKKWASEHPERKNIGRRLLRSKYVASVIARRNGIIRADIPTVLIDLKREQLRIQRLLRTMK